jgi:KDO2-lipid IV(A) lauroyltransferase
VALINLRLCFPEKTEAEREDLARRNFVAFSRAVIDRTLGWWASKERLERIIRITGVEHLKDPAGRPIILLSPHFVGLDAGATRISMHIVGCSVYSNQKIRYSTSCFMMDGCVLTMPCCSLVRMACAKSSRQ